MQEQLDQFEKSKVWTLVKKLKGESIIGAKWVSRNKLDKARKSSKKQSKIGCTRLYSTREN